MLGTLVIAALAACAFSWAASWLMVKASNQSAAQNIAIGGVVALSIALVLYLAVIAVEWIAFPNATN